MTSREHRNQLAEAAKVDKLALEDLLAEYQPIFRGIINKRATIQAKRLYIEDLMQACAVALCKAVTAYDPERGSFSTVAEWFFRDAIRDVCNRVVSVAKVTRYAYQKGSEAVKDAARLAIMDVISQTVTDGEGQEFEIDLPDESTPTPREEAERSDMIKTVREAVSKLPTKHRQAVEFFCTHGRKCGNDSITRQAHNLRFHRALGRLRESPLIKELRR